MRGLAVGLVALALAGGAHAGDLPDESQPGYVGADWLKKPTPEDLLAVWPKAALRTGKGGKATLSCVVTAHGDLTSCKVLNEKPEGAGFGGAALALTSQFHMKPATLNGKPVDGEVRFPINFAGFTPSSEPMLTRAVLPGVLMLAAPTYAEVAAAFPAKAKAKGVAGRAAMSCTIDKEGLLQHCDVISEEPSGLGFGTAARGLTPRFRAPLSLSQRPSTRGDLAQITVSFPKEMLDASTPPVVGKPSWVKLPTGEQLLAAMPKDSSSGQVRVMLDCLIGPDGSTTDCKVASEEPMGRGYGVATLTVASAFKMTVWTMEGLPTVGARVKIPVRFELSAPKPAPPP